MHDSFWNLLPSFQETNHRSQEEQLWIGIAQGVWAWKEWMKIQAKNIPVQVLWVLLDWPSSQQKVFISHSAWLNEFVYQAIISLCISFTLKSRFGQNCKIDRKEINRISPSYSASYRSLRERLWWRKPLVLSQILWLLPGKQVIIIPLKFLQPRLHFLPGGFLVLSLEFGGRSNFLVPEAFARLPPARPPSESALTDAASMHCPTGTNGTENSQPNELFCTGAVWLFVISPQLRNDHQVFSDRDNFDRAVKLPELFWKVFFFFVVICDKLPSGGGAFSQGILLHEMRGVWDSTPFGCLIHLSYTACTACHFIFVLRMCFVQLLFLSGERCSCCWPNSLALPIGVLFLQCRLRNRWDTPWGASHEGCHDGLVARTLSR